MKHRFPTLYKFLKGKNEQTGVLTNLAIQEVSFCVKGANPGAKINLFKSKKIEKEAATFSDIFVDPEVAEAKNKARNGFFDMLDALAESINRIAFDSDITQKERKAMMDKSISEFSSVFKNKIRDDLTKVKGEVPMTYEELVKMLGLEGVSEETEKTLKGLIENASSAEETAKQVAELKKQLEDKGDETDSEGDPADQDPVAKAEAEGASQAVIDLLKKQQEDNEALKKKVEDGNQRIDKMEEQNVRKECMQSATNLGYIEKSSDLSDILYDLKKACSAELYSKVEKLLETANGKIKESNLFKIAGKDGEGETDSQGVVAKVDQMAKDRVAKGDARTIEIAMRDIWQEDPALRKQYEELKNAEVKAR